VYDPRQQREQQALMPFPRSAGIEPVGATPLGDSAAEQREVGRRALAGVLWTTVEVWGERLLQFGFFVLLSRLLGPDAYGLIGIALLINFAGEVLFAQGPWADAIGRDPCPTPERWSSLFWLLLAASGTLALLAVAAAAPTAWVFDQPALVQVMPCLAPALPLTALGVLPSALLRRELRFAPFAARSALAGLVAGAVATAAALAGAGVWSLVLLQLVQPAVAAIVLWHAIPWRPAWHFSLAEVRPTLAFVAGGTAERLVLVADALLLRVVIGKALGPTALGHYVLATKALELLTQLLMRPVARVTLPSAVRLAADPLALRRLAERGLELAALIGFPAGLALAACATDLVAAIFGPAWAPSGVALQLMAVAVAVSPVAQLCTSLGYAARQVATQVALALGRLALVAALLLAFGAGDLTAVAAAIGLRAALMLPFRLAAARAAVPFDAVRVGLRLLGLAAAALFGGAAMLALRRSLPPDLAPELLVPAMLAGGLVAFAVPAGLLARASLRSLWAAGGRLRR
jgi:PST family polysaccharide transporter